MKLPNGIHHLRFRSLAAAVAVVVAVVVVAVVVAAAAADEAMATSPT